MRVEINGRTHELESDPLRPLLHVLREEAGVLSPKAGCQEGGCGACTVLLDGEPRRSCLLPFAMAEGAAVTTVEGLGDPVHPHALQSAFHQAYAAQCGYCTSGMLMAAAALLERSPRPAEEEVVDALEGHLCRCTGYVKIAEAVRRAGGPS